MQQCPTCCRLHLFSELKPSCASLGSSSLSPLASLLFLNHTAHCCLEVVACVVLTTQKALPRSARVAPLFTSARSVLKAAFSRRVTPATHWHFHDQHHFCLMCRASYRIYTSLMAQLVKNPPAIQETPVQFLGREDPLEKGEATYSPVFLGFPGGSAGKESACNAGSLG